MTYVEPHTFKPLHWWDKFFKKGKCKSCYHTKNEHPMIKWCLARPIGG